MPSSGFQTSALDRKSTRLNSSHTLISYAVFCLKKKNHKYYPVLYRHTTPVAAPQPPEHASDSHLCHCRYRIPTHGSAPKSAYLFFFFFKDTAPPEISPLPLHDALPIYRAAFYLVDPTVPAEILAFYRAYVGLDRKSTRLNSSHTLISYAVFCLKKN